MGQAQTLSAVQRRAGRGGPIVGARRVSFCLAVRPGRIVQLPTSTPISCPKHPAQVAVLVSSDPSTGPPRYWSEKDPQGGLPQWPEEANPEAHNTNTTTRPSPPTGHGPGDTSTMDDPRRSSGGVASSTILIAVPSTRIPEQTSNDASMREAPQDPVGHMRGRPDVVISSSSSSLEGRGFAFKDHFLFRVRAYGLIAQSF
jgi:hypothetical protein